MQCFNHPEKDAIGACVYCGKLFCSECLVEVGGKNYCKSDVENVIREAKDGVSSQLGTQKIIITQPAAEKKNGTRTAVLVLSIIFGIIGIVWSFVGGIAMTASKAFTEVSTSSGGSGLSRGNIGTMILSSFFTIVAAMVVALVGSSQNRKRTPTIFLGSITIVLGLVVDNIGPNSFRANIHSLWNSSARNRPKAKNETGTI